jgi:hypothetical protein
MQQHDALAYAMELGYTFDHEWKPRASVFYGFGTGDKNGVITTTNASMLLRFQPAVVQQRLFLLG